jgi:hypothetical protein
MVTPRAIAAEPLGRASAFQGQHGETVASGAAGSLSVIPAAVQALHRTDRRRLAGTGYDLRWSTIDGGGVIFSTGGEYELSGTIGQPDAGVPMVGPPESGYELTGGFWFETPPGECDADGLTSLTDYTTFEECLAGPLDPPPPGCSCFDVNRDGYIDLKDFGIFQAAFNTPR